jgi:exosortase/archaeosortase family protein
VSKCCHELGYRDGDALSEEWLKSCLAERIWVPTLSGRARLDCILPLAAASAFSLLVYGQYAVRLGLKIDEVFNGVFDTSVPAYPIAGMLFVAAFAGIRWRELRVLLSDVSRNRAGSSLGVAMAVLPAFIGFAFASSLGSSYSFAGVAIATSWAGVVVALRPSSFRFLLQYLLVYVISVGSVGALTAALGDPLSGAVASVSSAITILLRIPVVWSSTSFSFVSPTGQPFSLYISQECSGMASISIFLLLIALMHLDLRPRAWVSLLFGAAGSLLFLILNSFRVVFIVLGGIVGGADLMWSLHGWVGYVLYLAGYTGIALLYTRTVAKQKLKRTAAPVGVAKLLP